MSSTVDLGAPLEKVGSTYHILCRGICGLRSRLAPEQVALTRQKVALVAVAAFSALFLTSTITPNRNQGGRPSKWPLMSAAQPITIPAYLPTRVQHDLWKAAWVFEEIAGLPAPVDPVYAACLAAQGFALLLDGLEKGNSPDERADYERCAMAIENCTALGTSIRTTVSGALRAAIETTGFKAHNVAQQLVAGALWRTKMQIGSTHSIGALN